MASVYEPQPVYLPACVNVAVHLQQSFSDVPIASIKLAVKRCACRIFVETIPRY